MDRTVFRYEEPYSRPRRKANLFGWTIAILLLFGLALAAWLGSYYIFNQPERPDSYRILQKLHKIEAPKRFQLTAAPAGEFLDPKQLQERYGSLRSAEFAKANAELARNYIRNYAGMAGLVPYVVGRYSIMEARPLTPKDLFTSGMVALTAATDNGELLMEHLYPADAQALPLMQQTLATGLEIKLERAHDLSAVIHVERLRDGRTMITTVPLLYGTYTVTQGRGMFSLEPPYDLNMAAGWPLFKDAARHEAEIRYATFRAHNAPPGQSIPLPGLNLDVKPTVAANELVRVESAMPVTRSVARSPAVAQNPTAPKATSRTAAATPPTAVASPLATTAPIAGTAGSPTPLPGTSGSALASTAGGGSWKTFPPGKMPAGRLITTSDLHDVAERGMAGERIYLRGKFVVNFAEANRAVLRPKSNMAESVLRLGAPSSTRIIVEFPAGHAPPPQGSTVDRDEARPYEVTEVRKQSDGQLNVFVREIIQ
ncbi:MAG: hypothetical protein ACR2ID_07515 [Chthoniobacterales bacterium]